MEGRLKLLNVAIQVTNLLADLSPEELARQVAQHDPRALTELYDRYAGRVYAFLLRAVEARLAEELVQDVFMALWQKAYQFDPTRGSFPAWFFTLVRRRLYDALPRYHKLRAESNLSEPGIEETVSLSHDLPDLEEQVLGLFRDEEVRQALRHLPAEQRHILVMTYFGGFSQREVAEQLNLPISTVKGRARLGLQRLRQLLPEQG